MPGLFVPPSVSRELEQERMMEYAKLVVMQDMGETMTAFNRDLKQIDPYLELIRAKEHVEPGSVLRPGFWHIVRHNPGAPPSIMTIEGADGEFVEPSSAVFRQLTEWCDLQNPAVAFRRREREREVVAARERHEADEMRRMNEEVHERYLAANRAQVSMTDNPWSQNSAGRRGRRVA